MSDGRHSPHFQLGRRSAAWFEPARCVRHCLRGWCRLNRSRNRKKPPKKPKIVCRSMSLARSLLLKSLVIAGNCAYCFPFELLASSQLQEKDSDSGRSSRDTWLSQKSSFQKYRSADEEHGCDKGSAKEGMYKWAQRRSLNCPDP